MTTKEKAMDFHMQRKGEKETQNMQHMEKYEAPANLSGGRGGRRDLSADQESEKLKGPSKRPNGAGQSREPKMGEKHHPTQHGVA